LVIKESILNLCCISYLFTFDKKILSAMKKLLLLIALVISQEAKSQTNVYHPFPDSNIVWIQRIWWTDFGTNPPCVVYDDQNLFISGDTAIGAFTYHKLYANGHIYSSCPGGWYYFNLYRGAFRQDIANKKVYLYCNNADELVYDFNMNAGDTVSGSCINAQNFNYIQSVDSVLVGSLYHRQLWLSTITPWANNYASMIEGIGTSLGAFEILVPPFESGSDLFCVMINNQTVWTNPMFPGWNCSLIPVNEIAAEENLISVFPNPATEEFKVQSLKFNVKEIKLVNVFGEETVLKSEIPNRESEIIISIRTLPKGFYFYKIKDEKGNEVTGKILKQ